MVFILKSLFLEVAGFFHNFGYLAVKSFFIVIFSVIAASACSDKQASSGNVNCFSNVSSRTPAEPWSDIFSKTDKSELCIYSKKNPDFRIKLNKYQNDAPCMEFDWKGYRIYYYEYFGITSDGHELANVFQIRKNGKIIYDLRGNCFFRGFYLDVDDYLTGKADPYDVFFMDLTGDGEDELLIAAGSKGAYSYWKQYVFMITRNGISNIMEYYAGTAGYVSNENKSEWEKMWEKEKWDISLDAQDILYGHYVKDLDGNGISEIIMLDSSIEQICGFTHGPRFLRILEWDGVCFRDKTRQYPDLARKAALGYLDDSGGSCFVSDDDGGKVSDSIMPYYANMIQAGMEIQAADWIARHCSGEIIDWFEKRGNAVLIRETLNRGSDIKKISAKRKYVY